MLPDRNVSCGAEGWRWMLVLGLFRGFGIHAGSVAWPVLFMLGLSLLMIVATPLGQFGASVVCTCHWGLRRSFPV